MLNLNQTKWSPGLQLKSNSHSGPWFNIKMSSYQYRKSHCVDRKTVRSSYLYNVISYAGKISSLYWIGAQATIRGWSTRPTEIWQATGVRPVANLAHCTSTGTLQGEPKPKKRRVTRVPVVVPTVTKVSCGTQASCSGAAAKVSPQASYINEKQ